MKGLSYGDKTQRELLCNTVTCPHHISNNRLQVESMLTQSSCQLSENLIPMFGDTFYEDEVF